MQIVTVTEETRSLFENLAPEEFFDPLEKEGHIVLGAIGEDEEGFYAAGVLCLQMEVRSNGEEDFVLGNLQWLYTGSEFRQRGAADALVQAFFETLAEYEIPYAVCDIPAGTEYYGMIQYLESWGFDFSIVDVPEIRMPLKKVLKAARIKGTVAPDVLPLSRVQEKQLQIARNAATHLTDIASDIEDCMNYCDKDVSCLLMKDEKPVGMALVYPQAENVLELAFLRTFPYDAKNMLKMIEFMAAAGKKKYRPDTELRFTVRNQMSENIVTQMLPDAKHLLVLRGVCTTMVEE